MKNIAFITDENYVIPTKTAINSIVKNIIDTDIIVNIIAVDISDTSKKSFYALQSCNIRIKVLSFSNQFADLGLSHLYVSKAALFKFQLPKIFPSLDTILYVDGDMILYPEFLNIFDYDISNYYAAVVPDMLAMEMEGWAKQIGHEKYFNSGMMYINLKKWRTDSISEKLIEYKKTDSNKHFMDQNALNAILGNNVLWISPTYNYMSTCTVAAIGKMYGDGEGLRHIAQFYNIPSDEMEMIIQNPAILHVTSQKKAWKDISSERIDEWIRYVVPEDFLKIAKDYCLTISEDILHLKTDIEKQNKMIASLQRKEKIFSYKLKEKIFFKTGGNSIFYTLYGFSSCESWGCWTDGKEAAMKFLINPLLHDLVLDLDYDVFGIQHVFIYINDNLIAEYDAVSERKRISVPKSMIPNNEFVLRFEIPTAKSPKELGVSSDTRCLGLGFKKLLFY